MATEGEDDRLVMMLSALSSLRDVHATADELVEALRAHQVLFANLEDNQENEALIGVIRRAAERWRGKLLELKKQLPSGAYPFDHARGEVRLAAFLVGRVPSSDEIGAIVELAAQTVDRYCGLHARILGRLVAVADAVEMAAGLPELPEPAAESAEESS